MNRFDRKHHSKFRVNRRFLVESKVVDNRARRECRKADHRVSLDLRKRGVKNSIREK